MDMAVYPTRIFRVSGTQLRPRRNLQGTRVPAYRSTQLLLRGMSIGTQLIELIDEISRLFASYVCSTNNTTNSETCHISVV